MLKYNALFLRNCGGSVPGCDLQANKILDFPIISTKSHRKMKNLQTPLVLLFDEEGIIKYVRTATPSRGEHIIFFNVIEQIL